MLYVSPQHLYIKPENVERRQKDRVRETWNAIVVQQYTKCHYNEN